MPETMPTFVLGPTWVVNRGRSDNEKGTRKLPDHRLVCRPHGLIVCGSCCVDYSFMDEALGNGHDSEDESEEDYPAQENEMPDRVMDVPGFLERWNRSTNHSTATQAPQLPADAFGSTLRRGTGRVFPTKFISPNASVTPGDLFSGRRPHMRIVRQVRRTADGI